MAKKGTRHTIDLKGLEELIDQAHDGPLWDEMSTNQRVRVLLRERLAQLFPDKAEDLGVDVKQDH